MYSDTVTKHTRLDTLVRNVTERWNKMTQSMTGELTLQEDVARIIRRIKEEKENEETREKADALIIKLKKEL